MLAADPRLELIADEDGTSLVLTYKGEPRSLLYCAIACRQALAVAASAPAVRVYLSISIPAVGRRFWLIAIDAEDRLEVSREIPAALRLLEATSPISAQQPEPVQ
jgi:hypothetical protein